MPFHYYCPFSMIYVRAFNPLYLFYVLTTPLHILCTMAIATHNKTLALRFVVPTVPYTFWYDNTFLYELGSNLPLIQFFTALLCILHYNLITLTPLCGNDESAACKRQFVYYLACAVAVFM